MTIIKNLLRIYYIVIYDKFLSPLMVTIDLDPIALQRFYNMKIISL